MPRTRNHFNPSTRARGDLGQEACKHASTTNRTRHSVRRAEEDAALSALQWRQAEAALALIQKHEAEKVKPAKGDFMHEIESEPSPLQKDKMPVRKVPSQASMAPSDESTDVETEPDVEMDPTPRQTPKSTFCKAEVSAESDKACANAAVATMGMFGRSRVRSGITPFDGARCPPMSLQEYVVRLRRYMKCSVESFTLALIYIGKLAEHQQIPVDVASEHRLYLTALVLASKFQDDYYCDNAYYSMVGGVSVEELNAMEARMLQLLRYRLQVSPEDFAAFRARFDLA